MSIPPYLLILNKTKIKQFCFIRDPMNLYSKSHKEANLTRQLVSGDKYKTSRLTLVLTKNQNHIRHKVTFRPITKWTTIVNSEA